MSSIAEPTIYPQSVPAAAASPSPRESFGPVFVVLAVIAVLATVACVVGRLCARRMCKRQAKRDLPPRGSYDGRREEAMESPRPRPLPPLPRGFLAAKGDIEDGCYEIVFPAAKPVREKQAKEDKKYGGGGGGKNYTMNYPEIGGKKIGAVDSTTFKQAKPST